MAKRVKVRLKTSGQVSIECEALGPEFHRSWARFTKWLTRATACICGDEKYWLVAGKSVSCKNFDTSVFVFFLQKEIKTRQEEPNNEIGPGIPSCQQSPFRVGSEMKAR